MTDRVLGPGSTIGIIGGGQLGRMLCLAAARLGLKTAILDPAGDSPAGQFCGAHIKAAYDDRTGLRALADISDVVTYEFENVPVDSVTYLAEFTAVHPGARALEVSQDRLVEKTFLNDIGLATAPFAAVDDCAGLGDRIAALGTPVLLKTRRFGYDGKGQIRIDGIGAASDAHGEIGHAPAIIEAMIPFTRELSIIAVRGLAGEIAAYDPVENVHRSAILHTSTVPADITPELAGQARSLARTLMQALEYVGVLAIELFEVDGALLVNEFAPRVHNSGHWTVDACAVSQFENHVRAICGWPLGSCARHSDAVMTNLIGREAGNWAALAGEPGACLHLYGKAAARPGRKMGHVTRLTPLSK